MINFLVPEVVKNEEEKEDKRIGRRRKSKSKKTSEESEKDGKDADDFIVDDEDRPIAGKSQKKSPIISDAALQEDQDILCVNFDYHKFWICRDEDYEEDERDALVEDERSHRQELKTFDEEGHEGDYLGADDFIVDDEDRQIAGKSQKKSPIFSDAALQEDQDTLCVNFDYHKFWICRDEDYEEDEEKENEYVEETLP